MGLSGKSRRPATRKQRDQVIVGYIYGIYLLYDYCCNTILYIVRESQRNEFKGTVARYT